MAAGIHVGDVGTKFIATVKNEDGYVVDISSATENSDDLLIRFEKPDGTVVEKQAEFENDGTDGKMVYETTSGDLDQSGVWRRQGYVNITTGEWYTDVQDFTVEPNL